MFNEVPGKMTLIVSEVPARAFGTVKAHSIAELRERFNGNDEGYLTDPTGEKHYFSLKPWAKVNPHTTYLQIKYRFTPDTPIPTDSPLYPRLPYGNSDFTAFAIRNKDHEIAIRSVRPKNAVDKTEEQGISISYLLTFPEVKQTRLPCPVCDAILELSQPLEKPLRVLTAQLDADTASIEVSISHPSHVKETKTRPANYPFTVMRHEEL